MAFRGFRRFAGRGWFRAAAGLPGWLSRGKGGVSAPVAYFRDGIAVGQGVVVLVTRAGEILVNSRELSGTESQIEIWNDGEGTGDPPSVAFRYLGRGGDNQFEFYAPVYVGQGPLSVNKTFYVYIADTLIEGVYVQTPNETDGNPVRFTVGANVAAAAKRHAGILESLPGGSEKPGLLCLRDHTDALWYLWVDHTGDLRIHNAIPTDEDADGTVVGAQS